MVFKSMAEILSQRDLTVGLEQPRTHVCVSPGSVGFVVEEALTVLADLGSSRTRQTGSKPSSCD